MAVELVTLQQADGSASAAQITQAQARMREACADVAGLEQVIFGRNFRPESEQYTHVVRMRFADRDALENFRAGQVHQACIEINKGLYGAYLIVGYEAE